ncbi:MAG: hypothetical protein CMD06_02970 [Flavobacteriales bacterium]|nr:hypothetical protein [Flavobacteriales bacterium]|tara:strand:- start:647 stop:1243 length:597 start_codon:yes stop_codon:yes gene_type:complete
MDNFIAVLKKYSDFESSSSRKEYWMFVLFNIVFSSLASIISPKISMLYSLFIFIPALAVTVRRLHDVGKSGWMLLIVFIPLIGPIWLLVLLLQKGVSFNEFFTNDDSYKYTEKKQERPSEEKKSCCSNDDSEDVVNESVKDESNNKEQVNSDDSEEIDDEMIEYKLDDGTIKKMKKTHAAILPKSHPARKAYDEINSN